MLTRQHFVNLTIREGGLALKGNKNKAGSNIEKYLSVFRQTLGQRDPKYFDESVGYDWCCAYVYYLLKEVGYKINPLPLFNYNSSLASVGTWYEWAKQNNSFLRKGVDPQPGDLILFDYLIEEVELDHIGVVIQKDEKYLLTSEGNYFNCSGIFKRNINSNVKGYINLFKV